MRVFSYIRVSSAGQVDKDGPERQREAISAFVKTHKLEQFGEAFDQGVSGTVEGLDRPALTELLEKVIYCEANGSPIHAIVVERMDRLARDLMVSELLLAECRRRKLKVFSADQGALNDMAEDGGDPTRVLIRQIMGALAQWEKSTMVRKLRSARERVKARTGRCDGAKDFGYYEGEASTLNYMKMLCTLEPRPSFREMARNMNEGGLVTRRGGRWSGSLIHKHFVKFSRQSKESSHTI